MKSTMRNIFSPVLKVFESGEGEYSYRKSHRTILLIVGFLFWILASVSLVAAVLTTQVAAAIPFLVFFSVGSVCFVVGGLGTDRAVAKIWGNREVSPR
jgi:uncharacterized membrane protein